MCVDKYVNPGGYRTFANHSSALPPMPGDLAPPDIAAQIVNHAISPAETYVWFYVVALLSDEDGYFVYLDTERPGIDADPFNFETANQDDGMLRLSVSEDQWRRLRVGVALAAKLSL